MIEIQAELFSDPDVTTLREWLSHPGRLLFQEVLANNEMVLLAEAANIRMGGRLGELQDAEAEAQVKEAEALVLLNARQALDQMTDREYKFQKAVLKPQLSMKQPTQP